MGKVSQWGLSNLWLIRWLNQCRATSCSILIIVYGFFWLISTLWHSPPLSVSLWWLYSPELQHSSLNASITQTSRYNDHTSSACFWGSFVRSLRSAFSSSQFPVQGSDPDVNVLLSAGVVPEVDRLWYPFLYVWTTEGEADFFTFKMLHLTKTFSHLVSIVGQIHVTVYTHYIYIFVCSDIMCVSARLWTTVTVWESCTVTSNPTMWWSTTSWER